MAIRLSTIPDYEAIYNPQDVIMSNANEYNRTRNITQGGKHKWKVGNEYFNKSDVIAEHFYDQVGVKVTDENKFFEGWVNKNNAVETYVFEYKDPNTNQVIDVEGDDFRDLSDKERNFTIFNKLLESYDDSIVSRGLSQEEIDAADAMGLELDGGTFLPDPDNPEKNKFYKKIRKRGSYTSGEINDMMIAFYYAAKEHPNSGISTKAVFNIFMKDEDFQNKIYQEYKNFYKEQEKVGFDQDKIPELRELLKANMDRVFRDELKTSYYGQDAERSNQLLMNDVEEFFLPIVQETAQRENRAAESILGIPLHKSDLMTGVYEFTKMFKMGHNGMKLMGEAGLADSKRSELKRFRKLISEGQTNIKIPRRLRKTGPLSEREYNLKDLEKQYTEDLENIEKRMVDILLDNEMVQQQLEAIGQSDVFNKEGDIDFDLDDWQQMLGKQAGQMIGLMLTLGYSSAAQHTSEVYTHTLQERAYEDALQKNPNLTRRQYDMLSIEEKNKGILKVIEEGRGGETAAVVSGIGATLLDAVSTSVVLGKAITPIKNLATKLLHQTWKQNAAMLAKGGVDLSKITGFELGTEWTQDLILKFGQQAALGKTMFPQYSWFNDRSWIGTGMEVILTTPALILGGRVGSSVMNNTWRQVRKLRDPSDFEHFYSNKKKIAQEEVDKGLISSEQFLDTIDILDAMRMVAEQDPSLNHVKFADFLLESGSDEHVKVLRENVLSIVKGKRNQQSQVIDALKKLQEANPRVKISQDLDAMLIDESIPATVKNQIRSIKKIEDKILLDHYKADLNISKILSYAGYVKNSTTQIQELNAENPDTPSRIFETKDEALEDLKQRAINELTNRGISKREATKTINDNIKNGYIYENAKKGKQTQINNAYKGLILQEKGGAFIGDGVMIIHENVKNLIMKEYEIGMGNIITHEGLHVSMKRAKTPELRQLKADIENELKALAKTDPKIAQLIQQSELNFQVRYGNKKGRTALEEWFTNLSDTAFMMKIVNRNIEATTSFEKIVGKVEKWFGTYRPKTTSIKNLNSENFIDFLKGSANASGAPIFSFKYKAVSKKEIKEMEKSIDELGETAFSETFEKDYEAKINKAYTPGLENLEEINNLFSEIIQKEAYRTRPSGARYVDLPGFDMEEFVKETLYGVNDATGKMRGISQFIWGDKAFDPNINDNFFSYVRSFLTRRAQDALKSGKVAKPQFDSEMEDAGVVDKEFEITTSKTSPFRTLITDENAEVIKNEIKSKASLIPDFDGFYTKMKDLYSSYLNPIVENLQYTEEQYNTYVNSDKFKSKVNQINEKRKKKLTEKQINGLARIDLREQWLRKNFSTIFPNLPQKVLNKNFQDLKAPKLDENGKHIRIGNNYQFVRKDITADDWVNYFIGEYEGKAAAIVDESGYIKTNTTGDTRFAKLMKEIEVQLRFEGLASLLNDSEVINKIQTTRDLEKYEELKTSELIGRIAASIDKDTDIMFMEKFGGFSTIPTDITPDDVNKQAKELISYLNTTKGIESAKFQKKSLEYHPFVVKAVIYGNTQYSEFDGSINRNFGKLVERNKFIDAKPTKSLHSNKKALKNLQKASTKVIQKLLDRYGYGIIDAYEGTSAETKTTKFLEMFGYIYRGLDNPKFKKAFEKDKNDLLDIIKATPYKDGVDLTGMRLMNTRFKLYKNVQKILKLTSKTEKLAKLKELAPEIEEANRVNIEVVKGLATDLIDLLKENEISKVQFLDLLQVQSNAVGGIKGLSALDFIEIREGSQAISEENSRYEELKIKYTKQANEEIKNKLAKGKDLTIKKSGKDVKVSKEEYLENRIKKLINEDIKNYGEHMGANSLTMAGIAEVAFNALKDPDVDIKTELEKVFLVHTQLLTSGEIASLLDTNPETGRKTLKINPDNIYRTIKLLSKEQQENIYGYDGRPLSEVIVDFQTRMLELEQKSLKNKALSKIAREENFYKSILTGNESVEQQIKIFRTIDKARNIANDPKAKRKGISMYDLDFTLLNTTEKVIVRRVDNTIVKEINGSEFAEQAADLLAQGYNFDFTQFNNIINAEKGPFFDMAKARAAKKGWGDIFIVTARSHEAKDNIYSFLRGMGFDIELDNIVTLQDGTPQAKAQWLLGKAADGYNDFGVYDDHSGVIDAANNLIDWLDIDSEIQQAETMFSERMNGEFRKILFESKGVNIFDSISGAQAEARGVVADEFSLMPPSADDFMGLLYQFMGKGKQGDAHKEWLVKTLIRPYSKAMRDVDTAKQTLVDGYRTLKKKHKDVVKILKKDTGYGGFNYESALRVFLWDKNGIAIPGISKRDLRALNGIVTSDPNLVDFANELGEITKLDAGYVQPNEWWVTGTIGQDFRNIGDEYRKMFLTNWVRNKDLVFDAQTLRIIQANYGTNFKDALQDVLYRMENGRMRPDSGHKFVNNFNQFINGSIGTTMFLNTRSAVLQTISAINYVNWSDNNPLKAGVAFANQPQFWKDFVYIFQSDMLKQRRSNLAFEVTANELATAVQNSGDKARSAVQYLLRKGFLPTQMADSFAIAFGGASMYRNRLNTYTKQGLSLKEAQKKAWLDFQEITEASQQSAREHMLSSEQASPLGRLILAFGNTPSQYNRLMKKSYLDLVNNRGDHKTNISKILYYGAVQNFMFSSMQNALFSMIFDPDEGEGEDDKYLSKKINTINNMSDTILRGLGIRGATISTLKNMIIEFGEQNQKDWNSDYAEVMVQALNISPPVGIKARQIYGATQTYKYNKDAINEMGVDIDNPAWLALGQVTAGTTNIPLDRVVKKVNNVRAALDDRNEAWQRIATMLGWNTWNVGIPNRKRDAIKNKKKQKKKSSAVTEYEQLLKDLGVNE